MQEIITDIQIIFNPHSREVFAKYGDTESFYKFEENDEWFGVDFSIDGKRDRRIADLHFHYEEMLHFLVYFGLLGATPSSDGNTIVWNHITIEKDPRIATVYTDDQFDQALREIGITGTLDSLRTDYYEKKKESP